jgi:multiple sugar transport system permease protein
MNKILYYWNKPKHVAYLFIAPAMIVLTVFVFIPLISAFILSFTNITIFLNNINFVGSDNFIRAFTDKRVINALLNTFYFVSLEVPLQVIVGLVIAAAVSGQGIFDKMTRSVLFIPVLVSLTAIGIIWSMILDPNIGIIPYLFTKIGFAKPMFLRDPTTAMPTIIFMTIWKNFGTTMIILVAGIQGISPTYYEAAQIDGANTVQRFFLITIPLLLPTLSFCIITNLIGSLQVFDQVYVATRGGPMFKTETIVQYIYSRGFASPYELGYASAIAVILFVIITSLSLGVRAFLNYRENKLL